MSREQRSAPDVDEGRRFVTFLSLIWGQMAHKRAEFVPTFHDIRYGQCGERSEMEGMRKGIGRRTLSS